MLKKSGLIAVICISFLSVQTATAQIRYGFRGGMDIINNDFKLESLKIKNSSGFTIGGALDVKIPIIGLGLETGLQYGHAGMKTRYDHDKYDASMKVKDYNYLTVPLMLKKTFSFLGLAGIYVKGGVYGDLKLSGGDVEVTEDGERVKYGMQTFQKGLAAGAGITLFNHLEAGVNYRHRLGSAYTSDIEVLDKKLSNFNKINRNTWSVTLAYYF